MRPNESFVSQPVRSLQTMLRVIAEGDDRHSRVIPDGIYGPNTTQAVSTFQRIHGLPVTGIADQATWDTIVPVYQNALVQVDEAQPLLIILNPGQVIRKGEQNPNLFIVQAILSVLADAWKSIPAPGHSGILDVPTAESLSAFQAFNLLPVTGELDKLTWKYLAQHYPSAANFLSKD